jgi:nitrogen fixation/metabolism regulation signal transduction histidine kinase
MNNPTSLMRKGKNLQSRLVLTFSALFVFCILALSLFLFNVLQVVSLNNQAQTLYEENQRIYQLENMFRGYHLGIRNYAISASPLAEQRLTALERRIDETLQDLQDRPPADIHADFETLTRRNAELQALAAQIIEAVDDEDWDTAAALSLDANNRFDALYAALGTMRAKAREQLESLAWVSEAFSVLVLVIGLLSIPAFLLLALLVAMILYAQINLPLEQLAQAAQDLKERKFNPADLEKLAQRQDEIGDLAREFLKTASAVEQRSKQLKQEAGDIRARIR